MDDLPIMGFNGFSSDGPFMTIDEQKKEADNFLQCIVHHLGDTHIKTCVLDGRTSETILEYALNRKADLIVIGTQNHGGFEKLCPGNITSIILKRSDVPVLVIPAEKNNQDKVLTNQYGYLQI